MSKERQGGQETHNQSKPNQLEQLSHSGGGKGSETQTRPTVWDILERQVKLWVPGRPRMNKKDFVREAREVKLLKEEVEGKGTVRERLIFTLYDLEKMFMRPDHPGRDILKLLGISPGNVFLEELHSLRSRVEAMSDEQLVERVRWLEKLKEAPTKKRREFEELRDTSGHRPIPLSPLIMTARRRRSRSRASEHRTVAAKRIPRPETEGGLDVPSDSP